MERELGQNRDGRRKIERWRAWEGKNSIMENGIADPLLGQKTQNLLEGERKSVSLGRGRSRTHRQSRWFRLCFDTQKRFVKLFKQKNNGSRFAKRKQQWLEFMTHFPVFQDHAPGF